MYHLVLQTRFPHNVPLPAFDPKNFGHYSAKPLNSMHYPTTLGGGWEVTGPHWVNGVLSFRLSDEVDTGGTAS